MPPMQTIIVARPPAILWPSGHYLDHESAGIGEP
jgi:hypothetical protein